MIRKFDAEVVTYGIGHISVIKVPLGGAVCPGSTFCMSSERPLHRRERFFSCGGLSIRTWNWDQKFTPHYIRLSTFIIGNKAFFFFFFFLKKKKKKKI